MKIFINLVVVSSLFFAFTISQAQNINTPLSTFPIELGNEVSKQGPPIGSEFPLFDYIQLDQQIIPMDILKGKILVINVWYVGCKGCKQEEPFLLNLTESMKGNPDVLFLSFSMSQEEKTKKYLEKNGDFGFKTMIIKRDEVKNKFNVITSPTHFIIKNGILLEKFTFPIAFESIFNWYRDRILDISKP